jgi:diketogulonate reductase-like aldo/keto reductase
MSIPSFKLLDGTSIPWLGWGNGTGDAENTPIESGNAALAAGIRHIDTAQIYYTEEATAEVVSKSGLKREDIYVTSKSESRVILPAIIDGMDSSRRNIKSGNTRKTRLLRMSQSANQSTYLSRLSVLSLTFT